MADTDFGINPFADSMHGMFSKQLGNSFSIDDEAEFDDPSSPAGKQMTTFDSTGSNETLKSVSVEKQTPAVVHEEIIETVVEKKVDALPAPFEIAISDPQRVGDKLNSYILYNVSLKVIHI